MRSSEKERGYERVAEEREKERGVEERGGLARWKDIDSKRARRRGERGRERETGREKDRERETEAHSTLPR